MEAKITSVPRLIVICNPARSIASSVITGIVDNDPSSVCVISATMLKILLDLTSVLVDTAFGNSTLLFTSPTLIAVKSIIISPLRLLIMYDSGISVNQGSVGSTNG